MIKVQYISPDGQLIEAFDMADGLTLNQAARTICPDTEGKFPAPVIAIVGDKPAVRELGDWDHQLYGTSVQFRALAMGGGGGGGSNPLQVVMQVAVIALAMIASYYFPPALGLAAGSFGAMFAGGLAGAAVMLLGTMLMGALFQQKIPSGQMGSYDAAQASPTYSINSSGNQARLYQQEPEGFGRMKITPDFVANTWTQYVGNDQVGYFVYSLGRGLYEVESLQFGETVFWRDGTLIDSAYVDDWQAWSQNINVNLPALGGMSAPQRTYDEGSTSRELTATVHFPSGLCTWKRKYGYWDYDDDSGRDWVYGSWQAVTHTIRVRVYIRQVDGNGQPKGGWIDKGVQTFSAATTSAFSKSFTIKADSYAMWEMALSNETAWLGTVTASDRVPGGGMRPQTVSATPHQTINWTNVGSIRASISVEFVEPGNAVTIFPDNVVTSDEVSGQELFAPNDAEYDGVIGPYTTNPAGTVTNKLLFDFVFQNGVGWYDDQGKLQWYTVNWLIEYRLIDDFGNGLSEWATLDAPSKGGATLTPQRMTKTYDLPEGRYQVRVRRTSNTRGDGRTMDTLIWGAMRAMLPGTLTYPQSVVAFSIKANNALTQNASRQFSVILTRKLSLYDRATKTWSEPVATRSWAAAVSHVCKAEWGGRITDDNFDLDTLWAIDERLQARGWHYDSYLDGPYLVWTLLCEMCQSQCVLPRFVGPYLSFVEDAADRPPTFALTPRNIVRNTFSVNYVTWSDDTPDDVTIDYLDEDYGFQQRDVTASLPDSESREPASLSILGITNRDHAHKVGVRYACHNRYQRVVAECQVESLGRMINLGDVCTVAHPRFKNTAAGAVQAWDETSLSIVLTRDMGHIVPEGMEDSELYLALTRQDGAIWGPCKVAAVYGQQAVLDSGDYGTLLLQGAGNPFEWLTTGEDRLPTTWTLYTSRIYQRLMMVKSVTSQDALHYALKLGNYDPRMYRDDIPTPPWQGRNQLPTVEVLEAPQDLRGVFQSPSEILLVWGTVAGASWYDVELSQDGENWSSQGRANVSQMLVIVDPGHVHARVRGSSDTLQGPWATWQGDSTIPVPAAPVLRLDGVYKAAEARIDWQAVAHTTSYTVALKLDAGADGSGQTIYSETLTEPGFDITPEIQQGGPYRSLSVGVTATSQAGTSAEALLALSDPAPAEVTQADAGVSGDSVTLYSVSPDEAADRTGYILIKGDTPDFTIAQVSELRQTYALPYVWSGLAAGEHYFRVAVKDAFFDIARNPLDLHWSAVLVVTIADSGTEEGTDG